MLQILMPDGYEYKISFRHDPPAWSRCSIQDVIKTTTYPLYPEVTFAFALCNSKDTFSYEKGRKISLARAMNKMGWPKEWRALVWFKYFENRTENPDVQLILTYVPEAAFMPYKEALELAKERDIANAAELLGSVLES